MKLKEKILILLIGILVTGLTICPTKTKAALQSNGNPGIQANLSDWMMNIRKMEATGGTLGLSGSVNADLTSEAVNNLDIHMQKNTEYGAMAILSASSYGNPKVIADGESTTGNKTGIYIKISNEWVVAGCNQLNAANFKGAVGKYKNIYTQEESSAKLGDAMLETKNWHTTGGSESKWFSGNISGCGLLRGGLDTIFFYYGYGTSDNSTNYSKPWFTRAVVVVGSGF